MSILIIDDEEKLRGLLVQVLEMEGYTVLQAANAPQGLKVLAREDIPLVLCDVKLPDDNGISLLKKIKEKYPLTEVVMMTAYGTIQDGVRAMKEGAFDYLTKGDQDEQIIPIVARAYEKATLKRRVMELEKRLNNLIDFEAILGNSPLIKRAKEMAVRVAATDIPVLLLGETGTGKEVFAQAIHTGSSRAARPFVAVNCGSFAKDLLESEMFGYAAGAFTGANKDKRGLVDEAKGGTLFLDEIGEMNMDLQSKLLRFLETGTYYRVGDTKLQKADVRIIAATNRELEKEIKEDRFREDLYYRLSVFTIHLPALRDRKEDIPLLAQYFLNRAAAKINRQVSGMSLDFLEGLKHLEYKGNIRELKNIIERAAILTDKPALGAELLPSEPRSSQSLSSSYSLSHIERDHIKKVLQETGGNKTKAAELLGIGLTTLYRKLHEYGIE